MTKDWKHYTGLALFFYSFAPLLAVGVLPFMGLSLAKAGGFAVAFLASGEIAFLAAAALLGKPFLAALKQRFMALFKQTRERKPVGRTRHRIGAALFVASFVPYYAALAALALFTPARSLNEALLWILASGEAMCMVGLFLLGGQFWDRLKRLLDWPGAESGAGPGE